MSAAGLGLARIERGGGVEIGDRSLDPAAPQPQYAAIDVRRHQVVA
jgi:hypothetical protein